VVARGGCAEIVEQYLRTLVLRVPPLAVVILAREIA
jgi:hypothetical protein